MKGTVKNIVAERGFGFVKGEDGAEYFFHRTGTVPRHAFDGMQAGDRVKFAIEESPKGPRAVDVQAV